MQITSVSNVVDSIRIGDGEAINQAVGFPSKKGLAADTEFDGILG